MSRIKSASYNQHSLAVYHLNMSHNVFHTPVTQANEEPHYKNRKNSALVKPTDPVKAKFNMLRKCNTHISSSHTRQPNKSKFNV